MSVPLLQVVPDPHWPTQAGVAAEVSQAAQPGYAAAHCTAVTATHRPISQAVPAPQAGVHARGTHCPVESHTFPAPQKSAQVFSGVGVGGAEQDVRASTSSGTKRRCWGFKQTSFSGGK